MHGDTATIRAGARKRRYNLKTLRLYPGLPVRASTISNLTIRAVRVLGHSRPISKPQARSRKVARSRLRCRCIQARLDEAAHTTLRVRHEQYIQSSNGRLRED